MLLDKLSLSLYHKKQSLKSRFYSIKTNYTCRFKSYQPVDFLIIGGVRCGTTWLHSQLSKNPDFYLPTISGDHDETEVRFFENRIKLGLNWFQGLYNNQDNKILGDKSPRYYHQPNHRLKLIKSYNPNIKLIFLIRKPVERA